MRSRLPKHSIVLLGAGHTNAHILRMWKMKPVEDAQLICISNYPIATYSGMLPGVLAENYSVERMEIDLVRFCAAVNARLILDPLAGVDLEQRQLHFDGRPPLRFDALSVGVGSAPDMSPLEDETNVVPIKPMQTFLPRLRAAVDQATPGDRPLSVAVVGGGLGGVEISLCLNLRLQDWLGDHPFRISLVTSGDVGAGLGKAASNRLKKEMDRKGVETRTGERVVRVENGQLVFESGQRGAFDVILWATSAVAPPVLQRFELPKDERGFLLVDDTLRVQHDSAPIFAVGDSGTMASNPTPKAGVYAVRQGPVLMDNLRRIVTGRALRRYRPQGRFLKLVNLGDGRAIGEYGPVALCNQLMWKLKDFIDGRFMDKYQDYSPSMMEPEPVDDDQPMRCAGCGGKVGPDVLRRALERSQSEDGDEGSLDASDDVAYLDLPGGSPIAATVDFFTAPLNDPYYTGRIAALNSLSDMYASGVAPQAALAIATLPLGHPRAQEDELVELLAGGMHEFRKAQTRLAGGHTTEAQQTTIGYTILGRVDETRSVYRKSGAQPGDVLIVTKPLGSGVLLAAHMQARCRARWWTKLLEVLLLSNGPAAERLTTQRLPGGGAATALTDITGFGLAGHCMEVLRASGVDAELWLDQLPVFEGAEQLSAAGVESTLAPANRSAEAHVDGDAAARADARYALLFDPQTSGGLLATVPESQAESMLHALASVCPDPRVVGVVTAKSASPTLSVSLAR